MDENHCYPIILYQSTQNIVSWATVQNKCYTKRIGHRMPLLVFDFLVRVISHRIDAAPAFSALLTLWLSMMANVGEAYFSAHSRHFVYNA